MKSGLGGEKNGHSIRIGILTVSDRASRGEYPDEGGPAVHDYLREVLCVSWEPEVQIVSDDVDCVAAAIQAMQVERWMLSYNHDRRHWTRAT